MGSSRLPHRASKPDRGRPAAKGSIVERLHEREHLIRPRPCRAAYRPIDLDFELRPTFRGAPPQLGRATRRHRPRSANASSPPRQAPRRSHAPRAYAQELNGWKEDLAKVGQWPSVAHIAINKIRHKYKGVLIGGDYLIVSPRSDTVGQTRK